MPAHRRARPPRRSFALRSEAFSFLRHTDSPPTPRALPPRPEVLEPYALDDWGRDIYGPRWRGTDPQGRRVSIRCRPTWGPEATRMASRIQALQLHEQTSRQLVELAQSAGEEERLSEQGLALPVEHRHFPQLIDVLDGGPGRQLLVLEWVPGITLEELLSSVPTLTRAELHTLARGLCEALQEWHDQGLAHGDLSADNMVLSNDGEIILIDLFGSASERGTQPWAAPERLRGAPPRLASDIYSLAVVLRACARGPAVSRSVERVISGCLEDDPDARPRIDRLLRRLSDLPDPEPLPRPEVVDAENWGGIDSVPTLCPEMRRRDGHRRGGGRSATEPSPASSVRGWQRTAWVGLSCLSLLLAGTWGAHQVLTGDAPVTRSLSRAQVSEQEAVLRDIIARRDQAFADANLAALAGTVDPGSSLAERDRQTLEELSNAGARLEGLHTIIDDVELLEDGETRHFRLRLRQSAYRIVSPAGEQLVPEGRLQDLFVAVDSDTGRILEIRDGERS